MRIAPRPTPFAAPLGALLLVALTLAGCLGPEERTTLADTTPSETPDVANVTAPEPIQIHGSALIMQPFHAGLCVRNGIDGGMHTLPQPADGWWFQVEPEDEFIVYWWQDEAYLEVGGASGTVPAGSTHAEVCRTMGLGEIYYTLTLIHGDHEDHPDAQD